MNFIMEKFGEGKEALVSILASLNGTAVRSSQEWRLKDYQSLLNAFVIKGSRERGKRIVNLSGHQNIQKILSIIEDEGGNIMRLQKSRTSRAQFPIP